MRHSWSDAARHLELAPLALRMAAFGLIAINTVACGPTGDEGSLRLSHQSTAILGGQLSPREHDAVVFLHIVRDSSRWADCSGALVSPRIVVTAKHCVAAISDATFVCQGDGTLLEEGSGGGIFGLPLAPSAITVRVGGVPEATSRANVVEVMATDTPNACRDDVGVLILDQPLEVPAYASMRWTPTTRLGEELTLVGYGVDPERAWLARYELSGLRIVDLGETGTTPNRQPTTPTRSFVVAGNSVCSGDSGGPAFSKTTGAIVGTYSRITGDCRAVESRNTYMLLSGFTDLLKKAFAQTGETPRLETPIEEIDAAVADGSLDDVLPSAPTTDAGSDVGEPALSPSSEASAVVPAEAVPSSHETVDADLTKGPAEPQGAEAGDVEPLAAASTSPNPAGGPFSCNVSSDSTHPASPSWTLSLSLATLLLLLGRLRRRTGRRAQTANRAGCAEIGRNDLTRHALFASHFGDSVRGRPPGRNAERQFTST